MPFFGRVVVGRIALQATYGAVLTASQSERSEKGRSEMRVEHGVLRRTVHAGISVAVTLTLFLGAACEHLRTGDEPPIARAVTLDPSVELSVVMSRLSGRGRRTVSSALPTFVASPNPSGRTPET